MQSAFAVCVLLLVGLAGIVPFAVILGEPSVISGEFTAAYNAIMLQPWSSVVYAVLFGVGAVMCFQITKPVFAVFLLPALLAAVWPIIGEKPTMLPVPSGAIVAFAANHDTAPEGNMGCPIGWTPHTQLAGRFPLGAGRGEANPDG